MTDFKSIVMDQKDGPLLNECLGELQAKEPRKKIYPYHVIHRGLKALLKELKQEDLKQ